MSVFLTQASLNGWFKQKPEFFSILVGIY